MSAEKEMAQTVCPSTVRRQPNRMAAERLVTGALNCARALDREVKAELKDFRRGNKAYAKADRTVAHTRTVTQASRGSVARKADMLCPANQAASMSAANSSHCLLKYTCNVHMAGRAANARAHMQTRQIGWDLSQWCAK